MIRDKSTNIIDYPHGRRDAVNHKSGKQYGVSMGNDSFNKEGVVLSLFLAVVVLISTSNRIFASTTVKTMTRPGGNTCCYVNCKKSRRSHCGLQLHRFPAKRDACDAWLKKCGNAEILTLSPTTLRKKFVCQFHFKEEHILPSGRLAKTAIPIDFREVQRSSQSPTVSSTPHSITSKRKYEVKRIPEFSSKILKLNFESPKFSSTEICDEVATIQKTKATKIDKTKTNKIKTKLRSSKLKYNVIQVFKSASYISPQSKMMAGMQQHNSKSAWSEEEKQLAISLFLSSPAGYRSMRKLKIILPDIATIKTWISKSKYTPGFNDDLFKYIFLKSESMKSKEKIVVLSFDELEIKQEVEYSKTVDMAEDLEDLGYLGRQNKPAEKALVLMIRGLFSKWKLQIGYFLTGTSITKHILISIIKKAIVMLKNCGLTVKALVCDQSPLNMSAIKALGVTINNPSFIVQNHQIFVIYDPPHLFNSIRNNLLNGYFKYTNDTDSKITFDDIVLAYNLDKQSKPAKLLPKLTDAHINPNSSQRMSPKYALQILSHSVASAINTNIDLGNITSSSARYTATFVDLMDKLFDILNSKVQRHRNPFKCAYSTTNRQHADIITKVKDLFQKLKKYDRKGKISRPPCFDGILLTLNSIEQLHENSIEINPYILTSRLNQDCLEKIFANVRSRGDCNWNPTARIFRSSFHLNAINNLMKPLGSANCEEDEDEYLDVNVTPTPDSEFLNTSS